MGVGTGARVAVAGIEVGAPGARVAVGAAVGFSSITSGVTVAAGTSVAGTLVLVGLGVGVSSSPQANATTSNNASGIKTRNFGFLNQE